MTAAWRAGHTVSVETVSCETPVPLDPWFITGLLQGEGSFTFSRSGPQLSLYFALKLGLRDRELLAALQHHFAGGGRIYPIRRSQRLLYRISRSDELERVVDHFDAYPLRGHKAATYAVWRQMVQLKRKFRAVDRERLFALAEELSTLARAPSPMLRGV